MKLDEAREMRMVNFKGGWMAGEPCAALSA
jgi:hypothetical protein